VPSVPTAIAAAAMIKVDGNSVNAFHLVNRLIL